MESTEDYSSLPMPKVVRSWKYHSTITLCCKCEVCGEQIKVTEEIFIEIEKNESQEDTKDSEHFKLSKFCQSCNKEEEDENESQGLTEEDFVGEK